MKVFGELILRIHSYGIRLPKGIYSRLRQKVQEAHDRYRKDQQKRMTLNRLLEHDSRIIRLMTEQLLEELVDTERRKEEEKEGEERSIMADRERA